MPKGWGTSVQISKPIAVYIDAEPGHIHFLVLLDVQCCGRFVSDACAAIISNQRFDVYKLALLLFYLVWCQSGCATLCITNYGHQCNRSQVGCLIAQILAM